MVERLFVEQQAAGSIPVTHPKQTYLVYSFPVLNNFCLDIFYSLIKLVV